MKRRKAPAELFLGGKLITPFQKLVMVSDGAEFAVDIERIFDEARRSTKAKHENGRNIMIDAGAICKLRTWEVERGQFYDLVRFLCQSKNQEINRLQLAVKLPWAILYEKRSSTLSFPIDSVTVKIKTKCRVHEQMSRFGGLSEERPSVFKTRSKLGTHLSTQCSGDERQTRPCAAR
ncbi:hypothetical protein TNCV_721121 [Trichonephila clavipes]|nr:hypothetical protein TNCV_721121 [Trichonephila clavipes]